MLVYFAHIVGLLLDWWTENTQNKHLSVYMMTLYLICICRLQLQSSLQQLYTPLFIFWRFLQRSMLIYHSPDIKHFIPKSVWIFLFLDVIYFENLCCMSTKYN